MQPLPEDVHTAADYAAHAQRTLDPMAWAYFDATAGDGSASRANRAAWDALKLLPRMLQSLPGLHTECQLLGRSWPTPLLVAPMALQRLAHPDGELAMALAAAAQGAGMVLSCEASLPLETVARAMLGDAARGPLWLQLYPMHDRGVTLDLVRRAEAAGYEALVLTVDAGVRAQRDAERRAGFRLPVGISAVNLPPPGSAVPMGLAERLARAPTWDDVAWLQQQTRLPVLLKGILHPLDAREALRLQVAGLIVSNHGGRTLAAAAATAQALPAIADTVGGAIPLLVDGGIREGADVLRALALGADAVLVGRTVLWALAAAGAAGAAHALRLLRDELALTMAQCGIATPQAAQASLLAR
nr:alpha-hydroxy acid oxidase [Ramlibacter cellulosilyticus]